MKKNRLFEDDWKQANDEVKVAKMQLKNMQANIQELLNKIDSAEELDAWVQSYLTKADDYLDSVKKYVVFGQDEETTVLQPTEVEPGAETPEPSNVPLPQPMPSMADYDPDAEETPAMDLTPEGPELPGEEGEEELPGEEGEEELPGEEGEEELPGEEGEEGEEELPGEEEELPGEEGEEEFPEEELPGEEEGEEGEEIEEPEDLDLDDEEFEMPSMGDFEIEDGEAVNGAESEMSMPKPEEEDQLTFDDVDFFNEEPEEKNEAY